MELFTSTILPLAIVLFVVFKIVVRKVVVREGHVGLLYRDGVFKRQLSVGARRLWRFGLDVVEVDVRERIETVPGQDVLSKDNLGIKVSLVMRYTVVDAQKAVHDVQDYEKTLYLQAQLALRAAVAPATVEEILDTRLEISARLMEPVANEAKRLGITVHALEIKDIMLPVEQRRAFTEVLKARELGKAALERTRAETASLRSLANAAKLLEANPSLLSLRTLETVESAGKTAGNTIVLGIPPSMLDVGVSSNGKS